MSEIIAIELATPRTSAEDVELAIALVLVKAAVVEAARVRSHAVTGKPAATHAS